MATRITYGPGGFDPQAPSNNVLATASIPDDLSPLAVMLGSLTNALTVLRNERDAAQTASQQTGALTNTQLTTQLRQTQGALADALTCCLRLVRVVASVLDSTD